jgi:hypothetical protein
MQGNYASSSKGLTACAAMLFISIAVLSGIHGYLLQSFISLLVLVPFLALAYPFSAFLLGRGPNAILFTIPIGYILHAVFLSITGVIFGIKVLSFILYFFAFAGFAFYFYRKSAPPTGNESWNKTDWYLLFLWLFCTLAVLAVPFAHIGTPVNGGLAYRAYFNTDFFRHMAVAANLANQGIPPENPYFSDYILRYYWFFHIIPAFWLKLFPWFSLDYLMLQFNVLLAMAFCAALYAAVRYFTQRKRTRIMTLLLFLFGGSYEGFYLLFHFYGEKLPWMAFREWNVDAILRWLYRAPQVDTLFRGMLYGPQHLIGLCMFFLLLINWKSASTFSRRMLLYFLVFAVTGFTVIIAGALILGCAVMLLIELYRNPREKWKEVLVSGALGIIFLAVFFFVFQMFGTKGGEVQFEVNYFVLANIAKYIPLNWGAILIAGVAGIIFRPKKIPAGTLLFYLALCCVLIIFINIDVPGLSEITLKMGILSYVVLLIFAAGFFDDARFSTPALTIALTLMLAPSFLTLAMDWYNNQDVSNSKFTSIISPEDQEIYRWIQTNVEKNACIQSKPGGDGFLEEYVTELPALGRRPEYLGDKVHSRLYQISKEEVQFRDRILSKIFGFYSSGGRISALSHRAGIQYFFISSSENLKPFEARMRGPYFELLRQEKDARLYRVVKKIPRVIDLERNILLQDDETGATLLEVEYGPGFFDPETQDDFETIRWMNSNGRLELISQKRLKGTFSFTAYSEPYRRQIAVFLNGRPVGGERAKIRGIRVNVKLQLQRGTNVIELREPETYPGKKPPTDADRTGRVYKIEDLTFTEIGKPVVKETQSYSGFGIR